MQILSVLNQVSQPLNGVNDHVVGLNDANRQTNHKAGCGRSKYKARIHYFLNHTTIPFNLLVNTLINECVRVY